MRHHSDGNKEKIKILQELEINPTLT